MLDKSDFGSLYFMKKSGAMVFNKLFRGSAY